MNCVACGESKYYCLDFHHTDPTKKDIEVSKLIGRGSIAKAIQEAKKCVVVCSNCHKKIHHGNLELTEELIQSSNKMVEQIEINYSYSMPT